MKHNKLVRDKIPAICEADSAKVVTRILADDEYKNELDKKLKEELDEYLKDDNLEELADALEVIYAIAEQKGSSQKAIEDLRQEKAAKRGGFKEKIFLVETIRENE